MNENAYTHAAVLLGEDVQVIKIFEPSHYIVYSFRSKAEIFKLIAEIYVKTHTPSWSHNTVKSKHIFSFIV